MFYYFVFGSYTQCYRDILRIYLYFMQNTLKNVRKNNFPSHFHCIECIYLKKFRQKVPGNIYRELFLENAVLCCQIEELDFSISIWEMQCAMRMHLIWMKWAFDGMHLFGCMEIILFNRKPFPKLQNQNRYNRMTKIHFHCCKIFNNNK